MAELIELVKSKVGCSTEGNALKKTKVLGKDKPFALLTSLGQKGNVKGWIGSKVLWEVV